MTSKGTGWVLFIAAMGMIFTLMAGEVSSLSDWDGIREPKFVGELIAHVGTVIAAFVAGRLIPAKK